jgi:FkbM family methyltransferase
MDKKIYSQNGENGIIETIFNNIGFTNKYYVEFGTEDGSECNTRYLREKYNFNGLLMDNNNNNDDINLKKEFITKDNILTIFEKYNIPNKFDILSIDIDSYDIYVCHNILTKYQPRIIVIEYNASLGSTDNKMIVYYNDYKWDGTNYFGASLKAIYVMGKYFNYSLIYCDNNGVNAFLIRSDEINENIINIFTNIDNCDIIYKKPNYGNIGYEHTKDVYNRPYIKYEPENINIINTYITKYGDISLYVNEIHIGMTFMYGRYWDEDTIFKLKEYIDPNKNIIEIGGHCGTSTILYSKFLTNGKIYVFEPQKKMFDLLLKNIKQNNLEEKIIPYNNAVFCYNIKGNMNSIDDLNVNTNDLNKNCNYGGVQLGLDGEEVNMITIDSLNIENVGFIHIDAEGAENFIFYGCQETIKKYKPVIFYENNQKFNKEAYNNVCKSYPSYKKESEFNIFKFCVKQLRYTDYIERFNNGNDSLLYKK